MLKKIRLTTCKHLICLQVGLDKETVRIWFGNRRQTEKKQEKYKK